MRYRCQSNPVSVIAITPLPHLVDLDYFLPQS